MAIKKEEKIEKSEAVIKKKEEKGLIEPCLTPKELQMIEKYCLGMERKEAEEAAGLFNHDGKYLYKLLRTKRAKDYVEEFRMRMKVREFCTKEGLEAELLKRLETASNKESVQIINTLMKLNHMGEEEKQDIKISFNWENNDPWK